MSGNRHKTTQSSKPLSDKTSESRIAKPHVDSRSKQPPDPDKQPFGSTRSRQDRDRTSCSHRSLSSRKDRKEDSSASKKVSEETSKSATKQPAPAASVNISEEMIISISPSTPAPVPSSSKRLYSQVVAPSSAKVSNEATTTLERSLSDLSLEAPPRKRLTQDTIEFSPPLAMVIIQATATIAIAVPDVRKTHDKSDLPGPVVIRSPPAEYNLLANIAVSKITKLPNRAHTSLEEEIKLFGVLISHAYIAEDYRLVGSDRQLTAVLGLLSEVPEYTVTTTSRGQRKLKRKPMQFVIPNPAKNVSINNAFVTPEIDLKAEVGTPATVEILRIQPEMVIALTADTHLLAVFPPRLNHLRFSSEFQLIQRPKVELGSPNVVMPARVCALPADVSSKLSQMDVTRIRSADEVNEDRPWLRQLRVAAQILRCFKQDMVKVQEELAGDVKPLAVNDYNVIITLGNQVIQRNRTALRPGANFSMVFADGRAIPLLVLFKITETEAHLNRRPMYLSEKTQEIIKELGEGGWIKFENRALKKFPVLVAGGRATLVQINDAEAAGRLAFCRRTENLLAAPSTDLRDFTKYDPSQTRPFRCLAALDSSDLHLNQTLCGEAQTYLELIEKSELDPSQKHAARLLAPVGATIAVRAPAGSGKTFMVAKMVQAIIQSNLAKKTLICTESNEAAGNIIKALIMQKTPAEHVIWMRAESDVSNKVDEFGRVDRTFQYSSINHLQKAAENITEASTRQKAKKILQLYTLHNQMLFRSAEINVEALNAMEKSVIMVATTTMAATVLQQMVDPLDVMICDEAGMIASSTALTIMAAAGVTHRLFIVGDERQLTTSCDVVYQKLQAYGERSLLNVLLEDPNATKVDLAFTYRFQPLLARLISDSVYEGHLQFAGSRTPHLELVNFFKSPNPFVLINCEEESIRVGVSQDNEAQRALAMKALQKLLANVKAIKNGELTVGIISAYSAARRELQEPIARLQRQNPRAQISLNTVDSAQGHEYDVSIVLLIRSDLKGFLTNINRLTVAITRSKQVLIVIGNQNALRHHEDIANPLTTLLHLSEEIDKNNQARTSQ